MGRASIFGVEYPSRIPRRRQTYLDARTQRPANEGGDIRVICDSEICKEDTLIGIMRGQHLNILCVDPCSRSLLGMQVRMHCPLPDRRHRCHMTH
jgi:hypothetical protein